VADAMDEIPPVVLATTTVGALSDRIAQGDPALARRQGTILVDASGRLAGMVTRGDLLRVLQAGTAATTSVGEAGVTDVAVAFPDETLHEAIARMLKRGIGRLPVVARADPGKVVGYLGRADILAARVKLQEEEEERERGFFAANTR
jgi:chloride channel protein, CIC family